MNKYQSGYSLVQEIKNYYDGLINQIKLIDDEDEKLDAIQSAANIAAYHNTGYWTTSYLEQSLNKCSEAMDIENYNVEYKSDSFLHVMTTGYKTGGHTRVVERWIEKAPHNQLHSVVMINYEEYDYSVLKQQTAEKNGEVIIIDNTHSVKEKALELRKLALKYEYIILHTHMDDIVPNLAFGTDKFKRPVIVYNHARHFFWLGKSIADLVLDTIKDDKYTTERRNLHNVFYLGIPLKDITYTKKNKQEIREKLGLPLDKKIIVTAGSDFKYSVVNDDHFGYVINELIDKDIYCYMIGLQKNNKQWAKIFNKSNGHIIPLGYIDFNNGFLDYISAADLYLDSYPTSGGTAIIDAISNDVPALSLETALGQLNYLMESSAYCYTKEDFIKKAKKILNDKLYADEILTELQKLLYEDQSKEAWNNKIIELEKFLPNKHTVQNLNTEIDKNIIDDASVMDNILTDKNFLNKNSFVKKLLKQKYEDVIKYGILTKERGVPYLFKVCTYKKGMKKNKVIRLFNIPIYNYYKN